MLRIRTLRNDTYAMIALAIVVVSVLAGGIVWHSKRVNANSNNWMSGSLHVESVDIPSIPSYYESCKEATIQIVDGSWQGYHNSNSCVFTAKSYRYALADGGYLHVSVGDDQKMYRVEGLNFGYSNFMASTQTDDLVYAYLKRKDFLSMLTLVSQPYGHYIVNGSFQNFSLDENDNPNSVDKSAISSNGKWLLLDMRYIGIVRFNLEDMSATRLLPYSTGIVNFAISNDGKSLALSSWNMGYQVMVYDTENCGQSGSILQSAWRDTPIVNPCPERNLDSVISNFTGKQVFYLSLPPFYSDDSKQLTLLGSYYGDGSMRKITVNPAGYTGPTLDYLALGDSISSGEGDIATTIVPQGSASCNDSGEMANEGYVCKYYRIHTDVSENTSAGQPREKCHLSIRSYPYLLAASMQLGRNNDPKQWDSVACSGAKTTDITSNAITYQGQAKGGFFDKDKPRLEEYEDRTGLQAIALNEMIPGRAEQIKFVEKYKPKVITLTAGANDIDFSEKLKNCLSVNFMLGIPYATTCNWATSKRPALAKQIQGLYPRLVSLYTKLYESSGRQAKIYVLGYPKVISDAEPAPCGGNIGSLDSTEREMIVSATNYLNKVIERAANAAGVKYLDTSEALADGRLCDDGQAYMTGIAFVGKNEIQETFHPNSKGQAKIAEKIKQLTSNNLLTYDICQETSDPNDVKCPKDGDDIAVPPITDFDGVLTDDQMKSQYQTVMNSVVKKGSTQDITLDKYSHKPGSILQRSLHSDPVDLGDVTVANDGSVSASITIPSTVPAGYHTLILTGETYSGEPIETTQTVLVTSTDSDDLDDNGIDDALQPCGAFIVASGQDTDLDGIDDACDPQISSEPELYRVRTGSPSRTYNNQPEHEDYLYVERNTRASSITGIVNEYDPDSDGWAIVGVSQGNPYSTTSVPDTAPAANFEVLGEGVNVRPYVYIRAGGYGCVSFTPTSLAKVQQGQSRTIKKVAYNTDKCRQESPEYDVDGNGQPDNTQALYTARNGDSAKNENLDRIYLYRNFYAGEAQLGISDYTPTGTPAGNPAQPIQVWNLLASSKPNEYIPSFNKLAILEDGNSKPLPTILTKKLNGQCVAYQPESTEIIKQTTQNTRYLKKLATVPGGVGCE